MKNILALVLFLLASLLTLNASAELEKVTLQLHWKYQFEFAGFIAAKEKGFYKEAGLDVTLKEYEHGLDIEKAVVSGKSEYGIYNSLSFLEYLRGKPLVLVSSYFKRAALVLVTKPEIKTPKELIGKKIMATTKEDFILNYKPYFDSYGVDIDDVELVPHSYRVDEFINGEVSAMTAFVSNEPYKLDAKGVKYNILDPSDDNLYVLQLELITSQNEVQNHAKRVVAFREASLKGWKYALSHKEELSDIIYNKYSSRISKKSILQEADAVEKLILPYTYSIGSVDLNFLNKQMSLFKKDYKVGLDKDLNDFIFDEKKSSKKIVFTQAEQDFIKKNKTISVCINYDQYPIDGYVDGKFVGIMADIYKKISQKTSLDFKVIAPTSIDDLKKSIESQKCDILSADVTKNTRYPSLKPTSAFTATYFTLISKLDKSFIKSAYLLKGKKLLTQLHIFKTYIKSLYPYIDVEVIEDRDKMMKMLLKDEAYAIVSYDEQADYIIDKYGYGKLKINGFLAKDKPLEISLGIQEDRPILHKIIQKALMSIDDAQLTEIRNSWKITRYHNLVDYSLLVKVSIVMLIIFLLMAYYQRKLKNFNKELETQVNDKTAALREVNEHLEESVAQKIDELIAKDEIMTAQSKQAVMGEMISMIAHQWRQPLNTITLNISNLQIKYMMEKKIEESELQNSLDDINQTISYLSETVDDFQTYFNPAKEKTFIEIDTILLKAINFVAARAKTNKVEIKLSKKSPYKMEIYPNELLQVILNILNNAIDAYVETNVENKTVEVYTKEIKKSLYICIKDSAGGISSQNIYHLFEPYFSTKGKNGTGLGLYMSQMIIEKQFNGKIEVESFGRETLFKVVLPITQSV